MAIRTLTLKVDRNLHLKKLVMSSAHRLEEI